MTPNPGPRPTPFRSEPRDPDDRPVPHNLDAERAILGAILLNNDALDVAEKIVDGGDFFLPFHSKLFDAFITLRGHIDPVIVVEHFEKSAKKLTREEIAALSDLPSGMPRVSNVEHYAHIVKEKAMLRNLAYRAAAIQEQALAAADDAVVISSRAVEIFSECSASQQSGGLTWEALETEADVKAGGNGVLQYVVDGLIPLDDMTMIAGQEGRCKTLLAEYIGKCVANGAPVFGCLATIQKPVLYLDAENHPGTHQVYLRFFEGIGPEEIRFRTLRSGVPSLTDPALLKIVAEKRPLLIVDSLIRFCGTRDRDASEMTEVMEQLARLVAAGATILLIHHTRRSDEEEYANSFVIGATVAWWYAITAENSALGVKRVQMIHKKARGGSQMNRNLIAFPAILDRGMFALDGDVPRTDKELLIDFVRSRNGSCNFNAIKNELRGLGGTRKKAALDEALESGELVKTRGGREVFFSLEKIGSGVRNSSTLYLDGSESGTDGNRSDETDRL